MPSEWQSVYQELRDLLSSTHGGNAGFMAYNVVRSLMTCVEDPSVLDVSEIDPENIWDSVEEIKSRLCRGEERFEAGVTPSEEEYLATKYVAEQIIRRQKRYAGKPSVRRAMKSLEKLVAEKERRVQMERARRQRRAEAFQLLEK